MSNLADSLAIKRAIEQIVDERITKITDVCFRVYKAVVISVNGDKMTVNILGDNLNNTITIPYSTAVSDAIRGDYVLVATTYNSWRNAVVWQKWNFKSPDGGEKIEVDTEMSDSSTNAVQNRVIKSYVDEVAETKQGQLSETQLAAVNSGITQSKVARYDELNQVEANPSNDGSYELTKLQVGNIVYYVPTGGGIEFPTDSNKANKLLFGDGNWKEPFTVNDKNFNIVGSIYAPQSKGLLQTAYAYAPAAATARCVLRKNNNVPAFESPIDTAYDVVTITTGAVKANTQYTIAVDIHWCSSVTFLIVKKDGSGLITTLSNAAIRNLWDATNLTNFIPISSQTNPGWIKIVSYSSNSSGGQTTIQTGTLDSNVTSGGQGFYVICSY